MQLDLTESECLVRDAARSFARNTVLPRVEEYEEAESIPTEAYTELAELGLLSVNVPEIYGGAEAGTVAFSVAVAELAGVSASMAVTVAVTNMVAETLARFGTDDQRQRYLPALCRGALGAFALSEAEAGSDPSSMRTTAYRDGDGWVIQGGKQWISHADVAELVLVWARNGEGTTGADPGLNCFVVERGQDGFRAESVEDKMGLRASHTVQVALDQLRVPASALLGRPGKGLSIALTALDGGRIGVASQAIGIAEAALGEAIRYGKDRHAFGQPITDFQAIRFMIADARKDLDAATLLTRRAARLKDDGGDYTRQAAMAKLYASEAAWRVCNDALQILGGYGYTREFPLERFLRDVRVTQIYEGTSEIQRLVIARSLLRR